MDSRCIGTELANGLSTYLNFSLWGNSGSVKGARTNGKEGSSVVISDMGKV